MVLSEKYPRKYVTAEKGYQGEVLFDQMMQSLSIEHLILNDLLLEVGNTHFQIDSLLIRQNKIHLYDVKNFEGDYYLEGDKLFTSSGTEI
ncbi:nuclease-related domain-containing protein [Fredinandcohnia sp. 179-A 10B2 NHS]|uniref:nuclease-related domain-containing protein n=1 Tax=Fredinandcohnia sp. 179-A 10B2 NHS TaxID=3235176 RepID=UPI0039A2DEAD